jgi:hypothetical protein
MVLDWPMPLEPPIVLFGGGGWCDGGGWCGCGGWCDGVGGGWCDGGVCGGCGGCAKASPELHAKAIAAVSISGLVFMIQISFK